jgi:hypothetical protein
VRILDHEAMKRKWPKEVPQARAEYAALSVVLSVATRLGYLVPDARSLPSGVWRAQEIQLLEAQADQRLAQIEMMRGLGMQIPADQSTGWKGWTDAVVLGFRPCSGSPMSASAPTVGSPRCESRVYHLCEGELFERARSTRNQLNAGPICGLTPRELFEFLKEKTQGNTGRIPVTVDWSLRGVIANQWVDFSDEELSLPYEPLRDIAIRNLSGDYEELVDQFKQVLQPVFEKLRRQKMWGTLVMQDRDQRPNTIFLGRLTQAIQEREFLKNLFLKNPLRLERGVCRNLGFACSADAVSIAEALMPEVLRENAPPLPAGIVSSLADPRFLDRIESISNQPLIEALSTPNE